LRGTQEEAQELFQLTEKVLKEDLLLTLSREKTPITNPRIQKVRFLGFELFYQKNRKIIRRSDYNVPQRTGTLQVHPDFERLKNRFLDKNIIIPYKDTFFPRELGFLTALQPHEIVEKYNQYMLGIGNYYYRYIFHKSKLNDWHYFLYYSC
jgi:hypothetical protein